MAAGFSAVIDDIVIGDRLDHLLEQLTGRRFMFVMLTPRPASRARTTSRRGTTLWKDWEWLDEVVRTETSRIGLWLDSSDLDAEETVDEILRRAWDEGIVDS